MTGSQYSLLVIGMGLATYLPRALPLVFLSHRQLPRWLVDWLDMVPCAILSALIAPELFATSQPRAFALGKLELLAAIPTLFVAMRYRSLAWTVLTGMLLYWLGGKIM